MKRLGICALGALLVGCAGMEVHHIRQDRTVELPDPEIFYVQDFSWDRSYKDQSAEGSKRDEYLARFQDYSKMLSDRIRVELMDVAPVYVFKTTDPLPPNGYIIKGDFIRMDEGSEAKRQFIGFTAGATKVYVHVRVYRVPEIETTLPLPPKSGKMSDEEPEKPQVVLTGGPDKPVMEFDCYGGSKANGGFIALDHNVTDDLEAAARKISWTLRDRFGYMRN